MLRPPQYRLRSVFGRLWWFLIRGDFPRVLRCYTQPSISWWRRSPGLRQAAHGSERIRLRMKSRSRCCLDSIGREWSGQGNPNRGIGEYGGPYVPCGCQVSNGDCVLSPIGIRHVGILRVGVEELDPFDQGVGLTGPGVSPQQDRSWVRQPRR